MHKLLSYSLIQKTNGLLLSACLLMCVCYAKAQTIYNTAINNSHFCLGNNYTVTFNTTGLGTTNTFNVELSDIAGSFAAPTTVGTSTDSTITITILSGSALSNNYKIRVVRLASPTAIGDTLSNLTITKPAPSFSITNNNTCAGTNVSFTNTSTGVSPFSCSYSFSPTAGAPATNNNCNPTVQFNPALGGGTEIYGVILVVTDAYGCANSISQIDSVRQKPDVSLDLNVYQSSNGVDWDPTLNLFVNCTSTTSSQSFLFLDSILSLNFNTNSSYLVNWGDLTNTTYTSPFSSTKSISHTYNSLGYFQLIITANNSNGCSSQKSYNLFNGYGPTGNMNNNGYLPQYCNPSTIGFAINKTLTNLNPPGTIYKFSVNDLSTDVTYNQSNLPDTIFHVFTKSSCGTTSINGGTPYPNSFLASLNITNPCNVQSGGNVIIRVIQKLIADFTLPQTTCVNSIIPSINLSVGSFFQGNNCSNNLQNQWTISPGTLGVNYMITSGTLITKDITIQYITPGTYTIKLKISQPTNPTNGCSSDSITKTICVQPTPIPNFTLNQNPASGCINNLVTTTNTSNTLGSCGNTQYKWIVYDSVTLAIYNSGSRFAYVSGTDSTSVNPVFNFLQKGKYKLQLQVTNSCGPITKDTFITIKDKPIVALKNDIVYCDNKSIAFNPTNVNHNPSYDSSYGTIFIYNWSITPSGFTFLNGNSSSKNPVISFPNDSAAPITYTVTLNATNECGVSQPDTQYITINPKPIVTALPTTSAFCSGGATNIVLSNNLPSGVTYTWRATASSTNLNGYSNQTTGNLGPINHTLINIGNTIETVTYRIVGIHGSTICLGDSISVIITVYPIPHLIATTQIICSGSATNLVLSSTVATSLYTWTAATTGTTTGFSNQVTAVTGPIVQTLTNTSNISNDVSYTIKAIANGCNSIDTIVKVTVKPIPQISNTVLTQSICSGQNAVFNPTSLVAGTTFNYTASILSGAASGYASGTGNVLQSLINSGLVDAVVRYSYTPSGGGTPNCIGSAVNFDVTVKPIPSATANLTTAFLCSGAQTNIVLTPTIAGTLYTWTAVLTTGSATTGFSNNATPNAGPIAQTITNSSTANSIVTYTITPILNGCVGTSFTSIITVYPGTTPGTVSSDATVCSGINNGTLSLTGNTGNVVNWEYSNAPFLVYNTIANTTTSLIYSNLRQSTRYRAVVQSGTVGSCSQVATNAVLITVDSMTVAGNLTGTDTVCTGSNTGNITLNNRRGNIVNWDSSTALSTWYPISSSATINPYSFSNLTQTTWYRVKVKNGVCPYINSDSVRIQVDALPSPAVVTNKQICATSLTLGVNDNLVANAITSGTGLWTYLSGPNTPTIVSPNATTSAINNMAIGTHLIQWKVSNGKCPDNTTTLQFKIDSPLVSTIAANQTICSGQIPSLIIGTTPIGGTGSYNFQWEQSSNGTSWNVITSANSANYQPPVLTANTYYRKVVTSGNCVVPSNSILITVLPSLSTNTIAANATLCFGNASPTIIGSTPTGGDGNYSYQWQKFNGSTWVNLTIADTLKDYSPNFLSNTTDFRRIITSSVCNGLQAHTSNIVTITINPLPIVNAGGDSSKCQNQLTYTLFGTPSGGTWSGTGVVSNTFNPSIMPLGNYTLVYTFTNGNGCTNRDTAIITVIAPPTVNAGNDFSICQNVAAIQLTGFSPTGGSWGGTGVTNGGIFNPTTSGVGTFKLFYNFTAGTGCGGLDSLLVTVNPKPNGDFVLPNQICPNTSITLTTTTNTLANVTSYNWTVTNNGTFSNTILSSYNTSNPTATFPENKTANDITYTIKLVTTTDSSCVHDTTKTIVLLRRPLAQFTTGSNVNCGPALYTMVNGTSNVISSYLWSTNPSSLVNINTATSNNPQITFPVNSTSAALVYNIQLIATRNDGTLSCNDIAIVPITVYPKPIIGFTSLPDSGCSPLTVNFTNTSNPQNTENINTMSFLWNFGIYGTDTARNTQRTFTNSGTIDIVTNVKVIGTTSWGCKDSLTKIIKVYPFPKADFVSSNYSSCAPFLINNSIVSLTQYPIANDLYTWQILDKSGAIISSSTGTTIPAFTINTPNDTVHYRLIASHTRGCKADTLTRMFITIANPQASFTMIDSIGCSPLTVNFTNTSTVGVLSTWTFSNGATPANTNPFNVVFNNLSNTIDANYTAKLVITAGSGCKDSITKNIKVYPKPKAIFSLPNILCADTTKTATNTSVFKLPSVTYGWSFINATTNTINNNTLATPTFTFIDNQTGIDNIDSIRLRVTSVDGCIDSITQTITIYSRPLAIFSVPTTYCGPKNDTILNTTSLSSTWSWSSTPALGFITTTSQNPSVLFPLNNTNNSIDYRIKLIATRTGTTCVDTTSRLVTIYPKPQALFTTVTKDSCGPRLVNFTNASDAKNGEPLNSMSYLWTYLNKNITTINTAETFTNIGVIDSIYTTRLIATSQHGCKDTLMDSVIVRPNAKASFTYTLATSCAPFNITASNVKAVVYPDANLSYQWYVNNAPLLPTGITFPGYTIATANDSVLIKLVTVSKNGCKDDSMEVWFKTIPNPVPNFTMLDSIGCTPLTTTFTNTSSAGTATWTFSNGATVGTLSPFTVTFNNLSNTLNRIETIKLVVDAGCKDSITKYVTIYPKPKAIFSLPNIICADTFKTATNTSIYKAPSVTYGWKFIENTSNTINDTTLQTPTFTFINNQTGSDSNYTVRLRVTSVDGCIDSITQTITIYSRPLAIFSVPTTYCGPKNDTILNTTSLSSTWSWSSTPALSFTTANSQNPSVLFPLNNTNNSIDYRIKLIATRTGTTCVDTTSRLLTIYPKPQANFTTITKDSCGPRLVNFTNTSDAKNGEPLNSMSYLWTYLNDSFSTTNAVATFTNIGVIDSIYNTRLIATSQHGCKDTLIDSVIVRPNAKASFTYTLATSCAPFNITASNVKAIVYPDANSSYQWYVNNVPLLPTGITFPGYTIATANDSVLIKLVTVSKNGCKDDSMEVWFSTIPNPIPNFTAIDSIGCTHLLVNFNNTSSPSSGLTYRWEFGSAANQSTTKHPNFTFYNYGVNDITEQVKLVITAGVSGCSDSITKPIIIKPLPRPIFNLSDSVLCFPNTLTVTNASLNIPIYDLTSFKWKVIGSDIASILNDTANSSTTISFPDNKTGLNKFYQIRLKISSDYGCIDSVQKTVRIPTRPITNYNFSADSSCAPVVITTNNTTLFGATFNWTKLDPNVIIVTPNAPNTNINFPSHKGILDIIYPIKLIAKTIDECYDTIEKPFKVFPLPIAIFTSDKDSGCSPLTVKFYNSTTVKKPASYFWNYGDGNSQINNADTITKTFVGSIYQDTNYDVKLVSTSANGCKYSTTKTIKVKASAYAKIKLTDTLICSNSLNPTKLHIQNNSYGSVDTFYWDFGDGTQLVSTNNSTINHAYTNEGLYTIILKATNSCKTSFDTAKIEVQTPPTVNFSKSYSIGCSPLAVSFTNLSTNIYKAKFLWNFGNGDTSNLLAPPTINYLQINNQGLTNYYMNLSISNICGVFSKNDSIKVNPKPISIFLLSADSGCSPLPIYMINQSVGLPTSYKWYFGNGDSSLRFAPIQIPVTYITYDTISYFKIKLFATNNCGIDSMEKTIKVFPNTVNSFFNTSGNNGCDGLMVNFYDYSTGGNNISWNFGDGITSLLKNPTHQYNTPGTFYAYQYVNNGCSFDTSFVVISVLPKPLFTISKSVPNICIKNPVQFNANLVDSGVITWHFGDGDTSNAFNPIHIYNSAGKKYITVTLKSFYNMCVSIKYDTINVMPIPVITLTADTNQACAYHLFKFNASSPQTNLFNWNFGDNNTGAGTSLTHLYQFGGTYTVKIVAQTSLGCIDSTTKQLIVFPVPTSAFSYTPKDTCKGPVTVKFTNLSVGANNYLWNFGNGNNSTNVNPSNTYSSIGSYPIQLISNNQFSCYDTSNSNYFVYQTPIANLDFSPDKGCMPLTVKFENKSQFGTNYLWSFGDGATDTSFSPSHEYLLSGKYKVKLTVKAGTVCFDSITANKEVTVFAKPVPVFTSKISTNKKPYRTVEFNSKTDSVKTFEWYFKGKLIGRGANYTHTFDIGDSGIFTMTLKIISSNGCDSSYSQTFELPSYWNGLYVPNAFTPTLGTGGANEFKPIGIEIKTYQVRVFNKWGELMWESTELTPNGEPKYGWDGNDKNGIPCMQGSYIWTLDAVFTNDDKWPGMLLDNGEVKSRGNVTLIR